MYLFENKEDGRYFMESFLLRKFATPKRAKMNHT